MKIKKITHCAILFSMISFCAQAENMFGAVKVDPHSFETYGFWCQNKNYVSDKPLENFHGCEITPIGFGINGASAKLISAFHGWKTAEDGSKAPHRTVFVELPKGELYRLKSTYFLTSPLLQNYFEEKLGRAQGLSEELSNLWLSKHSKRNLQLYGSTFCVEHYLKRPFKGVLGWCQGDTVVGGNVGYLPDVLSFTKAAILAQRYVYDLVLPVRERKVFHKETLVALNTDAQGRLYWAFGIPAAKPNRVLGTVVVRVYLEGGNITHKEFAGKPLVDDI